MVPWKKILILKEKMEYVNVLEKTNYQFEIWWKSWLFYSVISNKYFPKHGRCQIRNKAFKIH